MLSTCCGSPLWVERMLARRPFETRDALLAAAREVWLALSPTEWREAFTHHPMIGDRESLRTRFPVTGSVSEREQAGVRAASDEVLGALAEENAEYFRRFGYIFIVCASGRTAPELLAMLRARLNNDPDVEIRIAAEEHAKITERRLLGLRLA